MRPMAESCEIAFKLYFVLKQKNKKLLENKSNQEQILEG